MCMDHVTAQNFFYWRLISFNDDDDDDEKRSNKLFDKGEKKKPTKQPNSVPMPDMKLYY